MTGQLSDDGKYMWDGHGWVELPHAHPTPPAVTIDSQQLNQVAMQAGVDPVQLGQTAPYFDQNQDGIIQKQEMEKAAFAVANPPSPSITPPIPSRMDDSGFEQQEDGKPWQIKVLSILIIIMASLGGTIGQQVSKIDEKATKLEGDAARNMSSARALETLENQDVFRDESLIVEAKSTKLEAEQLNSSILVSENDLEKAWNDLLLGDFEQTVLEILLNGKWDEDSTTYSLCVELHALAGCTLELINADPDAQEVETCEDSDSYGQTCALRIIFNEAELSQYSIEQSGLNLSFSALYNGLAEKGNEPYVWGNASLNFAGTDSPGYAGLWLSDQSSTYHPLNQEFGQNDEIKALENTVWQCDYQGSICIDLQLSGVGLICWKTDSVDAFCSDSPTFDSQLEVEPFLFYEVSDPFTLEGENGLNAINLYVDLYSSFAKQDLATGNSDWSGYSGETIEFEIAWYDVLSSFFSDRAAVLGESKSTAILNFFSLGDGADITITLLEEVNENYNATMEQSVTLIEQTSAWKNGFVSTQTGDFISPEHRIDYLKLSYANSTAKYEIANNQTEDANEMRAKAGAVYSSVLYVSIATALCGIVTGRIDSKKYTMTMPMVVAALASFVYGCYVFANGII